MPSDHCLSDLENRCNHERILTFAITLQFCSPVYKRIYFIESLVNSIEVYIDSTVLDKRFCSGVYIEFTNLSNVDELKEYGI